MKKCCMTVREFLDDPRKTQQEKEKMLIKWALALVKGHQIPAAVHYGCGDVEEYAIPESQFDLINEEIAGVMEWKP